MVALSKIVLDMLDSADIEGEEIDTSTIDVDENLSLSVVSPQGTVDGYTLIEL